MNDRAKRIIRLTMIAIFATAAIAGAFILPTLLWIIPAPIRAEPITSLACVFLLITLLAARRHSASPRRLAALSRADLSVGRVLDRWLSVGLAIVLAAIVLTWLPHYLTWPIWIDLNTFADLAQQWDRGLVPYRDVQAYNFPGATYFFWILGKTAGWGHPALVRGIDASLAILLAAILIQWSRRHCGRVAPGLIGALTLFWHIASSNMFMSAQRDWHAAALAVAAILVLETYAARVSIPVSAVLAVGAASLRPQVIVFLPPLCLAAALATENPTAEPGPPSGKRLAIWLGVAALALSLAAVPILLAGAWVEFVRSVASVSRGYAGIAANNESRIDRLWITLSRPEIPITFAALALAAVFGAAHRRASAQTAALALLCVVFYRVLSPRDHAYLAHPARVVEAYAITVLAANIMARTSLRPIVCLALLALVLVREVPSVPRFCDPIRAFLAIGDLASGRLPARPPPGAVDYYAADPAATGRDLWTDYLATLDHLRHHTNAETAIASLWDRDPYPAFTGMLGRPPVFRAEGGLPWRFWGPPDRQPDYVADLVAAGPDSVVVWLPHREREPNGLVFPALEAAVRAHYELEAAFGDIEIWRRKR
jgi:hypothetical protein